MKINLISCTWSLILTFCLQEAHTSMAFYSGDLYGYGGLGYGGLGYGGIGYGYGSALGYGATPGYGYGYGYGAPSYAAAQGLYPGAYGYGGYGNGGAYGYPAYLGIGYGYGGLGYPYGAGLGVGNGRLGLAALRYGRHWLRAAPNNPQSLPNNRPSNGIPTQPTKVVMPADQNPSMQPPNYSYKTGQN